MIVLTFTQVVHTNYHMVWVGREVWLHLKQFMYYTSVLLPYVKTRTTYTCIELLDHLSVNEF